MKANLPKYSFGTRILYGFTMTVLLYVAFLFGTGATLCHNGWVWDGVFQAAYTFFVRWYALTVVVVSLGTWSICAFTEDIRRSKRAASLASLALLLLPVCIMAIFYFSPYSGPCSPP